MRAPGGGTLTASVEYKLGQLVNDQGAIGQSWAKTYSAVTALQTIAIERPGRRSCVIQNNDASTSLLVFPNGPFSGDNHFVLLPKTSIAIHSPWEIKASASGGVSVSVLEEF